MEDYVDAEDLVPFGALLADIRGTDKAVHVGYHSADKYDDQGAREHHWIAHMPDYREGREGDEEYLSVRIATDRASVSYVDFETACRHLEVPEIYSWDLVTKEVVGVEQTPVPFEKEPTLLVECPVCDRFGTTHPWKFDDYVPETCPCGYEGEYDVQV